MLDVHFISIPRLISIIQCIVFFCDPRCVIVQKSNFQMIGAAKNLKGLFYMEDSRDLGSSRSFSNSVLCSSVSSNVDVSDNSTLWHLRLGQLQTMY